jgi:hypothetical protein
MTRSTPVRLADANSGEAACFVPDAGDVVVGTRCSVVLSDQVKNLDCAR